MHGWAKDLFPICRSLTGEGVRQTLAYIQELLPDLSVHEVPTGTQAFDWVVPDEWSIRDAFIEDEAGNRVVDFQQNNLHLVGYSSPIDQWMTLEELDKHLYSLPDQPSAIPYVTSYYKTRWGFCLSHNQRLGLQGGRYRAFIDSELKPGVLNYGELILPGQSDREVLLSTYICHPSMGNNELSGPVVTTGLCQWLQSLKSRRYTYRVIFIPETLGSIVYLSRHLKHLKEKVIAGFNVTCIGDNREYSYLPTRLGNTLADRVAVHALKYWASDFKEYSWLDRGSDERQFCAPKVDLPVATIMRSKYGEYPEYHTSLDDLSMIPPEGLSGGYEALRHALKALELNAKYEITTYCEPQLGKRGLYPDLSMKGSTHDVRAMMDLLSMCDGETDLLDISDRIGRPIWDYEGIVSKLSEAGLLVEKS